MKIQIESTIKPQMQVITDLNAFIEIALKCPDVDNFRKLITPNEYKFQTISFGVAGHHVWVKQKDSNGKLSENRLLFLTNKH